MQGVLHDVHCTAMRFRDSFQGTACASVIHSTATACSWRHVRAQCMGQRQFVGLVSLEMCLWRGRAVGAARRKVRSTQALQRSTPCALCCHAALPWIRRHEQQGWGKTLGCPPHSTAQSAACSLRGEGAEVTGAGCEGSMMDGLRTRVPRCSASPSGQCELGACSMPASADPRGVRPQGSVV